MQVVPSKLVNKQQNNNKNDNDHNINILKMGRKKKRGNEHSEDLKLK